MSTDLEEQVEQEEAEFQAASENGRSIADIAEEGGEEERIPPMQIPLEGFSTLSVQVGGARPQTSSIGLRGGRLPVEGEFKKGDVIEFFVRARVSEIHFVDTVDKFGEVTGTERKHVAKPIAVRRLTTSEE